MYYYEIYVNDAGYKRKEPLTYSHEEHFPVGSIVAVPLKDRLVIGFVSHLVSKPKFRTKNIENALDLPPLPLNLVHLASWMCKYYASSVGEVTQQFLPKSLLKTHHDETIIINTAVKEPQFQLTPEQKEVVDNITIPDTYLLHGDTGTGKTRVYLELAKKTLLSNKSVILLAPEIGLTAQLTSEFQKCFGSDRVIVIHSRLTEKERIKNWITVLMSKIPLVVIGPRSALFSPIERPGLIIIDESHEISYKQEQAPHYHTTAVAGYLSKITDSILLLGSGTPSIVDYFFATKKEKKILRMIKIANNVVDHTSKVITVDSRERSHFTKSTYISDELIQAIRNSLSKREQSLLFLNRRGTARLVLCELCGWQATCRHCNLPMTYHGDTHTLRCHTCGLIEKALNSCPECQNSNIILRNVGTKAIFEELQNIFPHSKIQRFDTDNKKSERIEQHYESVRSGGIDILIGTQVLIKGFDLPNLSVVGILAGDASLSLPDFTAQERTYQLIRQTIGRVGRGHRDGTVILQTYNPDNSIIKAASKNNWQEFYYNELLDREKYLFPPYCFLLRLKVRRVTPEKCQEAANQLLGLIRSFKVVVDGPAPTIHEKKGNKYEWQLVVKSKARKNLLAIIEILPSGWDFDIDPVDLL